MKHFLKKTYSFFAPVVLLVFLPLYTACSDDSDCSMAGRSMVYCNLYTIIPDDKQVIRDTLENLTVTAIGSDSVIINNQTQVSELMLPLRYTSDSTQLVFHYTNGNDEVRDTLCIIQTNTPFFESLECGYTMRQEIRSLTYTKHQIDSIYIYNKEANTNGTENLKIFYRYTD